MSEKLKITKITRFDKDKNQKPLTTKDGKPYTRVLINTDKYDGKVLSGFEGKTTANWKEGDEVEVNVEQSGQYLNFRVPTDRDSVMAKYKDLDFRLTTIEEYLKIKDKEGPDFTEKFNPDEFGPQ